MLGPNHAMKEFTGSNGFEFPNRSPPNDGQSRPIPFPNQNPRPIDPEATSQWRQRFAGIRKPRERQPAPLRIPAVIASG